MPMRIPRRRAELFIAGLLTAVLALDFACPLPQPTADSSTLTVLAADGTPLRAWPGDDGAQRQPTTPEAVSPNYVEALLHYEDRWFRWHPGVNPAALARAAWQWARHGRIVSGGSTLTMQVARLVDDKAAGRSIPAKLRQIARALQLELHLSKREILALYLNLAPMGGPLEGVETASRAYLGKGAADLSKAEAALLVALPQSPTRLRPDRAVQAAQKARDKVLTRMQTLGVWTEADVADAKLERVFAPPLRARWLAPLAAERLRQDAKRSGRVQAVIQTTLDAGLQAQGLLQRLCMGGHLLRANVGRDRAQGVGQPLGQHHICAGNGLLQVRNHRRLALHKSPQHLGVQARLAQGALQTQAGVQPGNCGESCRHRSVSPLRRHPISHPTRTGTSACCAGHPLHRRFAQPRPGSNPAAQGGPQGRRLDGFGHMIVHAGRKTALAIGLHRVGRHGHDGQVGMARIAAQLPRGRFAVHDRHLHVHQDQVVSPGARCGRRAICAVRRPRRARCKTRRSEEALDRDASG